MDNQNNYGFGQIVDRYAQQMLNNGPTMALPNA